MNYNKKHVEELGDAVETLEVLPTSTIKPIKVTLVRSIDQDTFEKDETNKEDIENAKGQIISKAKFSCSHLNQKPNEIIF